MNGPARIVALDDVSAGARLAQDVCDAAGRVLLTAGAELSAASLASLRNRGVPQVMVEEPLSAAELAALRVEVTQRLDRLFRNTAGDPRMHELHEAVLAYRFEGLR